MPSGVGLSASFGAANTNLDPAVGHGVVHTIASRDLQIPGGLEDRAGLAGKAGLEPATRGLTVPCSTD